MFILANHFLFKLSCTVAVLTLISCKKKIEVDFGSIERRTIIASVNESGTIQPENEVPVAPDVSGELTGLYVKEGQNVRKGDLLFEIRPDNYQAALEQSTAALNLAKSDYATAKANLNQQLANYFQDSINFFRNKALFEQQVISQAEFESFRLRFQITQSTIEATKQAIESAKFRIQSSEATLRQSKDNLTRTRVYASMDGTITYLNAQLGQRVVGTGMMPGTEVLRIADLKRMEVKVQINENDIVNVHLGDTATITVDAFKDKKFKGIVTEIAYAASVNALGSQDQITNYPVKVLILPESYLNDPTLMKGIPVNQSPFRPGMSAVVSIFVGKAENVLACPIQAVAIEKDSANTTKKVQEVIFILKEGNIVQSLPVVTGIADDNFIEIKSNVSVGTKIVSGPYTIVHKKLKNGMIVHERERKEAPK